MNAHELYVLEEKKEAMANSSCSVWFIHFVCWCLGGSSKSGMDQ